MTNKELFINGYLDRLSEQFKQTNDPGKNRNLAFEIFSIAAILDKPFQEVFNGIIINGEKDGGFDGIWFQDQGEYFDMHVFQCKNKKSLEANQIDKFRNDFRDIFVNGNKIRKDNISDLQQWIDEYRQISEQGIVIDAKLYFAFNGLKDDPQYANNKNIFDTYNDPDKNFLIVDSNDIYQKVANLAKQKRNEIKFTFHPEKSNISALDSQGLYTYAIQDIRAANFRLQAIEICQLMANEITVNGTIDLLFEENIRSYLGVKVRANKRMNETLNTREDAIYFPFLNNGITIICEELTLPRQPQNDTYLLPVKNPQIVNGLQTSWVLYQNFKKDPALLKDIFVNVRVYETKQDKDIIAKITDATNTQTPINYRDKISNKDFNNLTKTIFQNVGINYITKRGETFSKDASNYKESIESETVLKFWFATFFEEPETAKNSIAVVLQKIFDATTFEKHPLEKLFDGHTDSPIYIQLLTAYYIYKFVQSKKRTEIGTYELLAYADEIMCYGIYKYIGTNLADYKQNAKLEKAYQDTLIVLETIVSNEKEAHTNAGKTFSFNAYFKKPKCKVDFNSQKGIIENDSLVEDLKSIH